MSFGLGLLEFQQSIGKVNIGICKVFNIAKAEAAPQTKQERPPDTHTFALIVASDKLLNLIHRQHIFFEATIVYCDTDSMTGVFSHHVLINRRCNDFLKPRI